MESDYLFHELLEKEKYMKMREDALNHRESDLNVKEKYLLQKENSFQTPSPISTATSPIFQLPPVVQINTSPVAVRSSADIMDVTPMKSPRGITRKDSVSSLVNKSPSPKVQTTVVVPDGPTTPRSKHKTPDSPCVFVSHFGQELNRDHEEFKPFSLLFCWWKTGTHSSSSTDGIEDAQKGMASKIWENRSQCKLWSPSNRFVVIFKANAGKNVKIKTFRVRGQGQNIFQKMSVKEPTQLLPDSQFYFFDILYQNSISDKIIDFMLEFETPTHVDEVLVTKYDKDFLQLYLAGLSKRTSNLSVDYQQPKNRTRANSVGVRSSEHVQRLVSKTLEQQNTQFLAQQLQFSPPTTPKLKLPLLDKENVPNS